MKQRKIVLIVHNVRSAHNVGSLMRTADGLGVSHVYLSGYSPYPEAPNDERLPHIRLRAAKEIHKTALGAENTTAWSHIKDITSVAEHLRQDGFMIAALEQTARSKALPAFKTDKNIALIVGNEVDGLDQASLGLADIYLQIPMHGAKESFNVAAAAAIALYHLRYQA